MTRIQDTLKSDATRPMGGIGFVLPGMLRPQGPAGNRLSSVGLFVAEMARFADELA